MYKILFPHEPYDKKNVDSSYIEEYNICKLLGIGTFFFDYDRFIEDGKLLSNINFSEECALIYRGWMMKPEQYKDFYIKIGTTHKVMLINDPIEYENCHCFPNVYNLLIKYTPTILKLDNYNNLPNFKLNLKDLHFDFFIKDYVKSIKTDKGVERINKNINCLDLFNKINDFIKDRGNLFTGGIILKEYVDLKKINGNTNEWRFFIIDGEVISSIQNSNLKTTEQPPRSMVLEVINELKNKSSFFTIDFAQLVDDSWVLIETGDGQVSGFPSDFNPIGFYNNLK